MLGIDCSPVIMNTANERVYQVLLKVWQSALNHCHLITVLGKITNEYLWASTPNI